MGQPAWRCSVRVRYASCVAHQRRRWSSFASRAGDAHCVHNVHQLNHCTLSPKKHPSVYHRRRRIKVYLCQLVTSLPLVGWHTDGVARNTNYRFAGNYPIIADMYVGTVFADEVSHSSPVLLIYLFFLFLLFMHPVLMCNTILFDVTDKI